MNNDVHDEDEVMEEGHVEQVDECAQITAERDDYKNRYLRALADYQNFQKRARDDREMVIKQTSKSIYLKLLPMLDNLEKAQEYVSDEGVKMIIDGFVQHLKKEGLVEIEVEGREYDPYTAEAIDIVQGEQDNIVVAVLERGYEYQGEVIRPARVRVSKKV